MGSKQSHLVMVVEDDPDTRDALCEALGAFGYEALAVENGRAALEALRVTPEQPCIILLDIMMPIMDGWEFRELQQGNAEFAEIPVVFLTADLSARKRALSLGGVAFLPKPVEVETLLGTIREYC